MPCELRRGHIQCFIVIDAINISAIHNFQFERVLFLFHNPISDFSYKAITAFPISRQVLTLQRNHYRNSFTTSDKQDLKVLFFKLFYWIRPYLLSVV